MISAIIAIVGGLIAASSLIVAKKPNAQELLDKITPYQGWIGILLLIWGIKDIIGVVSNMSMMSDFLITWIIWLAMSVSEFIVGFVLGYGLLSKYVLEHSETAKEKGQALRKKLTKFQIPAGIILIILGILYIVFV